MVDVGFLSMRENMIKFLQLGTLELVKSQLGSFSESC